MSATNVTESRISFKENYPLTAYWFTADTTLEKCTKIAINSLTCFALVLTSFAIDLGARLITYFKSNEMEPSSADNNGINFTEENQPVAQGPVAQEPVAQGPVAQGPVAQGPVAQGPVAQGPVAQGPVAQGPVAQEPVAQEPVAQEPVAQEPVDSGLVMLSQIFNQ